MLFILYIVFVLLKLNEVMIWLNDSVIPSLAIDWFSFVSIRLTIGVS